MNRTKVFVYTWILVCLLIAGMFGTSSAKAGYSRYSLTGKKANRKAKPKEVSVEKTKRPRAPLAIFADVEEGWRTRKVDKILRHFGKGKVSISIGGAGPSGGYFSKNQSFYLFQDLFKYTITRKFEFTQYRNIHNGGRKVYAVAERRYQRRDDGRIFKDKIYVSLRRENDRWVISEIKSIH